jgi:hypothetical protein
MRQFRQGEVGTYLHGGLGFRGFMGFTFRESLLVSLYVTMLSIMVIKYA